MVTQCGCPPSPLPNSAGEIRLRIVDGAGDATPLAQPRARRAEHDDTMIAVPVGDVDTAAFSRHRVRVRIDVHVGRLVQQRVAHVGERVAAGVAALTVDQDRRNGGRVERVVAESPGPDLQERQGRAVVRILLHDAVAVAGDPDVVLVVDEAAVNAVGQDIPVAPRVHDVPRGVELDDGSRGNGVQRFRRVDEIAAGHDEDVVLRIDAGPRDFPGGPRLGLPGRRADDERGSVVAGARQWHLRPRAVGDEGRNLRRLLRIGLRPGGGKAQRGGQGQRERSTQEVGSGFHRGLLGCVRSNVAARSETAIVDLADQSRPGAIRPACQRNDFRIPTTGAASALPRTS